MKNSKYRFLTALGIAFGLLAVTAPLPVQLAQAASQTQEAKMKTSNALTGRTFVYEVAGYKIKAEFTAEDRLRWTYLEAPDGQQGKTAEEKLDRRDVHYGIVLLAWTEADGANVVDIFDLQTMTLHANFVMPDGKRYFTKTSMTELK